MMVCINDPPLQSWNATTYVVRWLKNGKHRALDKSILNVNGLSQINLIHTSARNTPAIRASNPRAYGARLWCLRRFDSNPPVNISQFLHCRFVSEVKQSTMHVVNVSWNLPVEDSSDFWKKNKASRMKTCIMWHQPLHNTTVTRRRRKYRNYSVE